MDQLIALLLHKHNIQFDKEELTFQIQSHPSYPSLHAITGVLDHFNIDNLALNVPVNKSILSQLPKVFLAQLDTEKGKVFTIVTNKEANYYITFSKKENKTVSVDEFLKEFTGIIVAIEKTEDIIIGEKKTNRLTNFFIVLLTIIAISFFIFNTINYINILYLLLSIIGLYISSTIIKQELGKKTLLGEAFCSNNSISKNNCDSVLYSKGAYIGNHKLSDFSIVYFIGLSLISFCLTVMGYSLSFLFIISLIATPITLYSIYYQYNVVKQWCILCLSIVAVLWIQTGLSLFYIENIKATIINISIPELLIAFFGFLSAFIIWDTLLSNIKLIKDLKDSKIKYFKFKRGFSLFESLLSASKTTNTYIEDTSEIVFGNRTSMLDITIVTSPFCGHCKSVHALVETILKKYNENLKITIRFNVNPKNESLINLTGRLLELYYTKGQDICMEAMHDIYGNMGINDWNKKWGELNDRIAYNKILKKQYEWCANNGINFTPELLINGKAYPKAYDKTDLIFFIEELEESCSGNNLETSSALKLTI